MKNVYLPSFQNTTKEKEEENQQSLTEEEVKAKIEEYNSKVSENGMKLVSTDFFFPPCQQRNPIHNIKTFLALYILCSFNKTLVLASQDVILSSVNTCALWWTGLLMYLSLFLVSLLHSSVSFT